VTSPPSPPVTVKGAAPARVVTARTAVAVTFGLNGLALASWFSRVPAARDALNLDAAHLGLLLLAMSGGAVLALTSAGTLTHRWGGARIAASGASLLSIGLAIVGTGAGALGSIPVAAIGLFAAGYGSGTCEVAFNVEGAAVERQLGRTVMPRFHAAWSIGTVTGAGLGALASRAGLPIAAHLGVVAAINLIGTLIAIRSFLPDAAISSTEPAASTELTELTETPEASTDSIEPGVRERAAGGKSGSSGLLGAWLEPRTLLIGLLVLAMAFTEGTANDWLAVAFVDGYKVSEAAGAIVFGVFVAAMTTGRTFGTIALDRWGRVPVLLASMLLAAAGTTLAVFAGALPLALLGVTFWGLGGALGFPVGMSAAADEEKRAAARVSVVATMGYTAFLAGPPLVGFLGSHIGVLRALLVVPVLLIPALALVPAARPPAPAPD
jgi:Major Facilitator Superfamily